MLLCRRRWVSWIWTAGLAVSMSGTAMGDDVIVKRFSSGDSAISVGIADASEDVELAGPQALTVDASGQLFMLDQLNQRIVRFDPKQPNEEPSILQMPEEVQAERSPSSQGRNSGLGRHYPHTQSIGKRAVNAGRRRRHDTSRGNQFQGGR